MRDDTKQAMLDALEEAYMKGFNEGLDQAVNLLENNTVQEVSLMVQMLKLLRSRNR